KQGCVFYLSHPELLSRYELLPPHHTLKSPKKLGLCKILGQKGTSEFVYPTECVAIVGFFRL
ncbi:MAG: hypothetical protein ACPGWR_34150, partial [Ardenticatenaceae bacterium]